MLNVNPFFSFEGEFASYYVGAGLAYSLVKEDLFPNPNDVDLIVFGSFQS